MTTTYTGGCACGEIHYEVTDEPVFQNHCQCLDCQRRSGTGHASFLTFPDRAKVKMSGEAKLWDVVTDSGDKKSHAFCPNCGTPIYLTLAALPGIFTVHAASLDDPTRFRPQVVTYHSRALEWDHLEPGLTVFTKMPPG